MYKPSLEDILLHYGKKRRSGRYPWGSGEDPYQRSLGFYKEYDPIKHLPKTLIAKKMGINTRQLTDRITRYKAAKEVGDTKIAHELREQGLSNVAIAKKLGISEGTVRNFLSKKTPQQKTKAQQLEHIADTLKKEVKNNAYVDIGKAAEIQLGVSKEKLRSAISKLIDEEGYHVHEVFVPRHSTTGNPKVKPQYTTLKVLTKEKNEAIVKANKDKIKSLGYSSDDKSLTPPKPHRAPLMVDLKRIHIRYAEDGGDGKDGLIELRRGVEDLDLGKKRYAQVRIGAGENLYLKGMAAYSDDKFPKGTDIIFNTNKKRGTPVEKVLKELKMNEEKADGNPSFMFGSSVQRQRGALNIVNEQGDWDTWKKTISSQFLSKQPTTFIKERLDATYEGVKKDFDELNSLTNPVVKKFLLGAPPVRKNLLDAEDKYKPKSTGFVGDLESKAKKLSAQSLANTKAHVLLPFPDMKENEIYAPRYKNGERVVLVRHPHGGIFEIPELVVNNKNETAKKVIGPVATDAVGIHPNVAQKLSGADFDGDTVLVIPNPHGKIKSERTLKELKGFDHLEQYKVEKDDPRNIHKIDKKTGEMVNTGRVITDKEMQNQMGTVSNLITDMTIRQAPYSEIARAVKHSMVIIDSAKHNLDWKQSAIDNGIDALRKKYQSVYNPKTGKSSVKNAATLISRSKKKIDISKPDFDPHKFSEGYAVEDVYANYIQKLQHIRNEAIKVADNIYIPKRDPAAAKKYASEVGSLNEKLKKALLNAPKERQAQILTDTKYRETTRLIPGMTRDEHRKAKALALAAARIETGADRKGVMVDITPKEWEAIQANALSPSVLKQILNNTNMDKIKELASPRQSTFNAAKIAKAKAYLDKGYTQAEVAEQLGISVATLVQELEL